MNRMIVLEAETRTHRLDLPRKMVERWERTAARKWPYCESEKADRLRILARRLSEELLKQPGGWPVAIEGPANWFAWIVITIGTPEDGLIVGRQLAPGD